MRILMCSYDAPEPRTNGIRLAVGALLDELRKRHEIRHIAFRHPDQRPIPGDDELLLVELPEQPIRGATLWRSTVRGRPWETDRLAAALEPTLRRELASFVPDVVHVNRWILAGLGRVLVDLPSVLSAFDAWHLNVDASLAVASRLRRPLIRSEAQRVRRFEAEEFARFGRVVVVTDADKEELERLNDRLPIAVVPNGVDAGFFAARPGAAAGRRLVFTGHMGYPPNIVAASFLARELLPRIRREQADAEVVIVGRSPLPEVLALADLDGVSVTGEVPDVRPWLESARAFVCPMLSGTGIKNKLLEAMAVGLPCVVTPLALQGIDVEADEHVLVGDSADELAAQAVRVLADDALAVRLGSAAAEYVRSRHSWDAAARRYEEIYRAVRSEALATS